MSVKHSAKAYGKAMMGAGLDIAFEQVKAFLSVSEVGQGLSCLACAEVGSNGF